MEDSGTHSSVKYMMETPAIIRTTLTVSMGALAYFDVNIREYCTMKHRNCVRNSYVMQHAVHIDTCLVPSIYPDTGGYSEYSPSIIDLFQYISYICMHS